MYIANLCTPSGRIQFRAVCTFFRDARLDVQASAIARNCAACIKLGTRVCKHLTCCSTLINRGLAKRNPFIRDLILQQLFGTAVVHDHMAGWLASRRELIADMQPLLYGAVPVHMIPNSLDSMQNVLLKQDILYVYEGMIDSLVRLYATLDETDTDEKWSFVSHLIKHAEEVGRFIIPFMDATGISMQISDREVLRNNDFRKCAAISAVGKAAHSQSKYVCAIAEEMLTRMNGGVPCVNITEDEREEATCPHFLAEFALDCRWNLWKSTVVGTLPNWGNWEDDDENDTSFNTPCTMMTELLQNVWEENHCRETELARFAKCIEHHDFVKARCMYEALHVTKEEFLCHEHGDIVLLFLKRICTRQPLSGDKVLCDDLANYLVDMGVTGEDLSDDLFDMIADAMVSADAHGVPKLMELKGLSERQLKHLVLEMCASRKIN